MTRATASALATTRNPSIVEKPMSSTLRNVLLSCTALIAAGACAGSDDQLGAELPVATDDASVTILDHAVREAFDHSILTASVRVGGRDLDVDAQWQGDVLSINLDDGDVRYSYVVTPDRFLFKYKSPTAEGGYSSEAGGVERLKPTVAAAGSVYARLEATTPMGAMMTALRQIADRAGRPDLTAQVDAMRARMRALPAGTEGFPIAPGTVLAQVAPTATASPSPSPTVSPSPSPTVSPSPSPTESPSPSPTVSPSPSPTPDPCDERHGLTDASSTALNLTIAGAATLTASAARATAGATFRRGAPSESKGMAPDSGATATDTTGPCYYISNGEPSGNSYTGKSYRIFAEVMPKAAVCDHPPGADTSSGPQLRLTVPAWIDLTINGCSSSNPTGTSARANITGDVWICRHRTTGEVTGRGMSGGWTCQ